MGLQCKYIHLFSINKLKFSSHCFKLILYLTYSCSGPQLSLLHVISIRLSFLFINTPKLWDSLLSASIISAIFSRVLKDFFAIPRPAQFYDNYSFTIIGKSLHGFNSLPSGHSITIFTALTLVAFAFMPQKTSTKIIWFCFIICTGLLLASTRVGVGAHHPLDVLVGSIIGFIAGIIGIFMSRKFNIWTWISNIKYYPVFILFFLICTIVLITKIVHENLFIYYFTLTVLIVSLYKIIYVYIKK